MKRWCKLLCELGSGLHCRLELRRRSHSPSSALWMQRWCWIRSLSGSEKVSHLPSSNVSFLLSGTLKHFLLNTLRKWIMTILSSGVIPKYPDLHSTDHCASSLYAFGGLKLLKIFSHKIDTWSCHGGKEYVPWGSSCWSTTSSTPCTGAPGHSHLLKHSLGNNCVG